MIELIGSLAGLIFFLSGVDQLVKTIKEGHARGLSLSCLVQILAAYVLSFVYVYLKHGLDIPLLAQYTGSAVVWSIITYYKLFPRGVCNADAYYNSLTMSIDRYFLCVCQNRTREVSEILPTVRNKKKKCDTCK